jgi:orotidine-5'-phosphate decarboxylase
MTQQELFHQIQKKKSFLCVGLDTDPHKLPESVKKEKDPVFVFNQRIIDATAPYAVAYKPNIAFYEAQGPAGWESLQKTLEYIPSDLFTIADAKRGDIGNTSSLYARAFFEQMQFDSITVAPYMGSDSVQPFLEFDGKWVILLAHTSNPGSADFQLLESQGKPFYEHVMRKAMEWGSPDRLMFVVGATRADKIGEIRKIAPEHFFLVPGVGAQGGDLTSVAKYGMNSHCGLLVNSSRGIIYASSGADFADRARIEAHNLQREMEMLLDLYL